MYSEALEAERNEELETAGKLYAIYAFQELVESNYQLGQQLRRGLTHMLESISADVRAENYNRPFVHLQMIEPLLHQIQEKSNEKPVQGLAYEWLGDAYLMLGKDEAIKYYERALRIFQNLSLNDRLFWGAEPEFDNAYGAMKEFLATYGIEYSDRFTIEFEGRINTKIDFYNEKYNK